jgi:hypothetical protein
MNWFFIISIIAIIVLIISLTFVGVMMKKTNQTQLFPASVSQCPDLWIPDGSFCHFNGVNNGTYNISELNIDKSINGNFLKNNSNGTIYDSTNITTDTPFFTTGGNNEYINSTTTINPYDPKWSSKGMSSNCLQKEWATINNIQWSGIREYNNC